MSGIAARYQEALRMKNEQASSPQPATQPVKAFKPPPPPRSTASASGSQTQPPPPPRTTATTTATQPPPPPRTATTTTASTPGSPGQPPPPPRRNTTQNLTTTTTASTASKSQPPPPPPRITTNDLTNTTQNQPSPKKLTMNYEEQIRTVKLKDEEDKRISKQIIFNDDQLKRTEAKKAANLESKTKLETEAADKVKSSEFKNKFSMFEKPKGLSSDDQIKADIKKKSQDKRFAVEMAATREKLESTGMSPMAIEIELRRKIGNIGKFGTMGEGEEVSFEGVGLAELKVVLDEETVTYNEDKPPSPMMMKIKSDGKPKEKVVEEAPSIEAIPDEGDVVVGQDDPANWSLVEDDGNGNEYWFNCVTNDTSYKVPGCLKHNKGKG